MKKSDTSRTLGFLKDNWKIFALILLMAVVSIIWYIEKQNYDNFSDQTINYLIFLISLGLMLVMIISILVQSLRNEKIISFQRFSDQNSKDELLSLASHQLRTPATAVKQYLGMLLEGYAGKLTKEQFEHIKKAYSSNERQLETINQILYVTKADAGRLQLQKSHFNLNQLVDEVLSELNNRYKEKDQKLVFKPKYVNITLYADKHCIRMVVENLLTNASKYTHRGGKVVIKTDKKPKIAILTVEDNGVGIGFEDRTKLFKKFSRIDNELSIEAGGSGIGLYLDKLLVEMHGGRISVVSEPNKGTLFSVHLPMRSKKLITAG
jgi:signal transduction histidine kinase